MRREVIASELLRLARELVGAEVSLDELKGGVQYVPKYGTARSFIVKGGKVYKRGPGGSEKFVLLTGRLDQIALDLHAEGDVLEAFQYGRDIPGVERMLSKSRDVGRKRISGLVTAAHAEMGGKWYADTAFINAVSRVYPGSRLEHLGFGEFYLDTPDGTLEFDRGRGRDFDGQSGRSHLLYDDAGGKVVEKAVKLMERAGKSERVASRGLTAKVGDVVKVRVPGFEEEVNEALEKVEFPKGRMFIPFDDDKVKRVVDEALRKAGFGRRVKGTGPYASDYWKKGSSKYRFYDLEGDFLFLEEILTPTGW